MNARNVARSLTAASAVAALAALLLFQGCFKEDKKPTVAPVKQVAGDVSSDIDKVLSRRGLTGADAESAALTYHPTGMHDEFLAYMTTGSSGRVAITGVPSMRIMKYVAVFTPEPWQGFGYDDESKALLAASARDEINYDFGDSGRPALSRTGGAYDGHHLFAVDAANARVGVVDLHDYETKQVLSNPIFRSSHPDTAITPATEYVLQMTQAPEVPGGKWMTVAEAGKALRGGLTFWKTSKVEETLRLAVDDSFTLELPPYVQTSFVAGTGSADQYVFALGSCKAGGTLLTAPDACDGPASQPVLHIMDWRKASEAIGKSEKIKNHSLLKTSVAATAGALRQIQLRDGAAALALSPDGNHLLVTSATDATVAMIDLRKLAAMPWSAAQPDGYGVPTLAWESAGAALIDVGGPSSAASFTSSAAYVVVTSPGKLVRINLADSSITGSVAIPDGCTGLIIPEAETSTADARYITVVNPRATGRFVSVGPQKSMNPILVDGASAAMKVLYDMSVPQATGLAGVAVTSKKVTPAFKYQVGTDTRTNKFSPYKTVPGDERVERDGKRVRVYGTLIRSHITPELVEVEEGDIVSFHLTNIEQAQDQTHGFTVSAYNVHGSWEPGKTASVTFTADKPGVYPYYCTEFCSALHLEMKGYLLVKPKGWKPGAEDSAAVDASDKEGAKLQFEAKMKVIKETQAVIDSVVGWLKEHNFSRDARATGFVNDAVEQLGKVPAIQKKIDESVAAQDWPNAFLWSEQYFQYQVKAADAGLRAKKIISELEDKK